MSLIRVTGSQLHAARVLVGLSRDDLAERSGVSRFSIRNWEISSNALPAATYSHLCRVVDVLEGEGARFADAGVYLQRPEPIAGTVAHSSAWRRSVYEIHLPRDRQPIPDDRTIKGEIAVEGQKAPIEVQQMHKYLGSK